MNAVVLAWCLLIVCIVIAAHLIRERFASGSGNHAIVYASHLPNVSLWLDRIQDSTWTSKNVGADGMELIRGSLLKSRIPSKDLLSGHSSMLVCLDPYVYEMRWKKLKMPVLATAPEGYFVAISSLTSAFTTECSFNLYGKRIGYTTDSEWMLIHAILYSYHIPKTSVQLVKVSSDQILELDRMLDSKIDVFITYIIPNSLYYAMLRLMPVSLMGWQNIDIERLRVYHPFVEKRTNIDIKQTFASPSRRSQLVVMDREKDSALLSISLNLYLVHGPSPPIQKDSAAVTEGFITRLDMPVELTDPAFQCYGDLTVSHWGVCDSKYDVSGMPKARDELTVWDRPCFADQECPYYQANKNYPNTRGGCNRGKCEFPIGVRRKSYRHFISDLPYTPLCYQCKDPNDPDCCEKQKDRNKYPDLKSPDYVFSEDKEARVRAKLPYFVSIA